MKKVAEEHRLKDLEKDKVIMDRLLKEGIELENRPVLKYLDAEDMEGLLNFALDMGYQERNEGYVSKCHLCLDIRKYLVSNGDYDELKPGEFYEQLNIQAGAINEWK